MALVFSQCCPVFQRQGHWILDDNHEHECWKLPLEGEIVVCQDEVEKVMKIWCDEMSETWYPEKVLMCDMNERELLCVGQD